MCWGTNLSPAEHHFKEWSSIRDKDLAFFHEGHKSSRAVCMYATWPMNKRKRGLYVPQDFVNRESVFDKLNAITWLLWPGVCVQMMKVIYIWNDRPNFFHSSHVEQTSLSLVWCAFVCVQFTFSGQIHVSHCCLASILDSCITADYKKPFLSHHYSCTSTAETCLLYS